MERTSVLYDDRMREYFFDHGARIGEDGKFCLSRDRFEKMAYAGTSVRDPSVRTLMVPSEFGVCLLFEGKHFVIED